MSVKELYQNLRLEPGQSVLVFNSPRDYEDIIGSIPEGVVFTEGEGDQVDFVHIKL